MQRLARGSGLRPSNDTIYNDVLRPVRPRLCLPGADPDRGRHLHDRSDDAHALGRYVFAIVATRSGGPSASHPVHDVKIFALMGGLAGIAAVIGAARQNSATNAMAPGRAVLIAAAVVGGTSLAGGVGTIYGAIIGALILTSLQTGMVLIGFGDGLPADRDRHRACPRRVAGHRLPQTHQVKGT